jgi:rRNA methylase
MAGTDRSRTGALPPGPAVVLVEPQLGENIGMAARAMLNAGLDDLRLVARASRGPPRPAPTRCSMQRGCIHRRKRRSPT